MPRPVAYALAALIALLGLVPNVLLSTAFLPLTDSVVADLHTSMTTVQLAGGLSNAGYAIGAVLLAQLSLRFTTRRLFLGLEVLFVVGSVVAATSHEGWQLVVGRGLEGLASGGILVCTLPLLLTQFAEATVPLSAAVVNVGLFGASAAGPLVGGATAAGLGPLTDWRALLWINGGVGLLGLLVALVAYQRFDPPDPERRIDRPAIALVVTTTVCVFVGTSLLTSHSITSVVVLVLLVAGSAALVLLFVLERAEDEPLVPVRAVVSQLPVTGTMAAMVGGAVLVAGTGLLQTQASMVGGRTPTGVASLFWPMPVGALVSAVVLALVFRTRLLPLLVDAGLLMLGAACLLLLLTEHDGGPRSAVWVATLLLGLGAGATVTPGLFLVALGLPSAQLGRAFAMVQLLRATATYAVSPVLTYVAMTAGRLEHGIRTGYLVLTVIAGAGLLLALVLPAVSGARLRRPDLRAWLEDGEQALPSPKTAVHLRPGATDDEAAPLLPHASDGGRHRRRPSKHR